MKSISLAFFALFVFCLAHVDAECPDLEAVPVDIKFFKKQPKDGFFVPLCKGMSTKEPQEEYEAVEDEPIEGADGDVCISARVSVNGNDLGVGPSFHCSFKKDHCSEKHCEMQPGSGEAVATALSAVGHNMPRTLRLKIVDTDNKTFAVGASCGDGGLFNWVVMATKDKAKIDEGRIIKALGITKDDVKDAKNNDIKFERLMAKEGECEKPDHEMGEVVEGGAGMFGGFKG